MSVWDEDGCAATTICTLCNRVWHMSLLLAGFGLIWAETSFLLVSEHYHKKQQQRAKVSLLLLFFFLLLPVSQWLYTQTKRCKHTAHGPTGTSSTVYICITCITRALRGKSKPGLVQWLHTAKHGCVWFHLWWSWTGCILKLMRSVQPHPLKKVLIRHQPDSVYIFFICLYVDIYFLHICFCTLLSKCYYVCPWCYVSLVD